MGNSEKRYVSGIGPIIAILSLFGLLISALIFGLNTIHNKQNSLTEQILQIGTVEPCIANIHLSVWEEMNKLKVYSWVAACEETLETK